MNFLTHLYFASTSIHDTIGIMIGKTVKENRLLEYNQEFLNGIVIDLTISKFSERNPAFCNSRQRLKSRYFSYTPFMVNIFYDHLLAKNWHKYSMISLEEFADHIYTVIRNHNDCFPYKIRKHTLEMIDSRWITNLVNIEGTHYYINSFSKSDRYPQILDIGLSELMENYQLYSNDFENYFAALREYIESKEHRLSSILNNDTFILFGT